MAVTTIPWDDGSGDNIYVSASSQVGDETVQVSSDANTGAARSQTVTFTSGVGGITRSLTVNQEAGSRLPSGYTEVEYIENTTTARINTGINGDSTWTLVAQLVTQDEATPVLFGRNTGGGHYFGAIPSVSYKWGVGASSGQYVSTDATTKTTIEIRVTSNKKFEGTIGSETFSRTASSTNTSIFYLFNASTAANYPFHGRLFGDVVCVKSGNVVFRGVPCKDPNGVAGLYDLVNRTFKGSYNSATFTAGPEI